MSDVGIIHLAGPPIGDTQKCVRCGYELSVAPMSFWAQGPVTVWEGNPRHLSALADPDAVECNERGN